MRKKYSTMLLLSLLSILTIAFIFSIIPNNRDMKKQFVQQDNFHKKKNSPKENIEKDTKNTGVETIKIDNYTIVLRGAARPSENEVSAEAAAETAIKELSEKFKKSAKDCTVEMIFLDGIFKIPSFWSVHINFSDSEKYEVILNGKEGKVITILNPKIS